MISIPYETIINKILQKTGKSKEEVEERINTKMTQLAGLISKDGAAHIIANEFGVKLMKTEGPVKLNEVFIGMKDIETHGKVIRKFDLHEFPRGDSTGKVASLILGDETDQMRITLWNNQTDGFEKINEGDILKIFGARAKLNNNQKELHIDTNSKLVVNPENVTIGEVKAFERPQAGRKKINELNEQDQNVELLATIVQVFDIRFFEICSVCSKRLTKKEDDMVCPEHGLGHIGYSYVLNTFLDDGSGTIRAVFFRNQLRNLLKKEDSEIQAYRVNTEVFEAVKNELLGEMVKIIGRATKNTMFDRLEFVANIVNRDVDPEKEIKELAKKLQESNTQPNTPINTLSNTE